MVKMNVRESKTEIKFPLRNLTQRYKTRLKLRIKHLISQEKKSNVNFIVKLKEMLMKIFFVEVNANSLN